DRALPVLMLTARDSETDLEVGLAVGGDDYLTKPFSPRELAPRGRALLRRADRAPEPSEEPVRLGSVVVDPATRRVLRDGRASARAATRLHPLCRIPRQRRVLV